MLTARFMAGKEYNDPWTDYEKTVEAVLDAISK